MTDRITVVLCAELQNRAAVGLKKYGVSLADAPLSRLAMLQHAKEEALDLAAYLQRLIEMESGR
jgi:hypothetical protein